MLQILPFLTWAAALTSVVLLVVLWMMEELSPRARAVVVAWLLIAAWLQFLSGTMLWSAVGLGLQTILAVYLLFRWKWAG